MEVALDLFDELRDVVHAESGPKLAEVAGVHLERLARDQPGGPRETTS